MLASLLPGFRHLRTPFAVGALCVFQLWILFGDSVPGSNEANGLLERVYLLGEVAGRPIVTAVIAFALYLIGDVMRIPWRRIAKLNWVFLGELALVTAEDMVALRAYALKAFRVRGVTDPDSNRVAMLVDNIQFEFPELRIHLIGNSMDVYMESDRLNAEGEFRINVAIYSVPLWVVLAFSWSPWFLFGAAASLMLYMNGVGAFRAANGLLVQSVIAEFVASRHFEEEKREDEQSEPGSGARAIEPLYRPFTFQRTPGSFSIRPNSEPSSTESSEAP
ncbi:hypothetical protein ACGFS9_22110 [Streptomyces sp. NPDC048566]|uniref:hypothetical protein n=1 Tax=Streptomyces sp. NPDC048566 TaxID=3365569 RepID=UPI0037208A53